MLRSKILQINIYYLDNLYNIMYQTTNVFLKSNKTVNTNHTQYII